MQRNGQLQLDVEAPFGVESAAVEVPCLVVVATHELPRLSNICTGCRISQGRAYSKKQDGLIGQQLSAIITTGSNRRSSHNLRSYNFAWASAWLIKRIIHYSTLLMFAVPSFRPNSARFRTRAPLPKQRTVFLCEHHCIDSRCTG